MAVHVMREKIMVPHRLFLFAIFYTLIAPVSVTAQDVSVETVALDKGRMNSFLNREAERLTEESWNRIGSQEKIESSRDELLQEFRFMIGLEPIPERSPLHVTSVRTIDCDGYSIEVLHYQSLPGVYVTANLYRPTNESGPFPAVIWGPGHSGHEHGAKVLRQNYAIPWVRAGYICLIIDPMQVSEVFSMHRGTHSWDRYDWYCRGYSPIGPEVWNAIRGLDYLGTRDDVDAERITINGVSGGGHLSWMAGAVDERFTVVQPAAATADIQAHVQLDLQAGHCDCAYFINLYRHDWPTLAALICPRPLMTHNSTGDSIYPPEGYNRVMPRVRSIYKWFDIGDRVGMTEVEGRHGYFQSQWEAAINWSDRWLREVEKNFDEQPFERLDDELAIFPDDPPADARNATVSDWFIPTATLTQPETRQLWERTRTDKLDSLKTVVFRNMPQPQVTVVGNTADGTIIETEEGIHVGLTRWPSGYAVDKLPILLYIASPGETLASIRAFISPYPAPRDSTIRYAVFPRGIGSGLWNETDRRRFERCSMLLGRTLDSMRLYDVLSAVDHVLKSGEHGTVTIAGKGAQGIIGAYAALLDERIGRVILHSPTVTHEQRPVFLNVLRLTDIPQALAMLAPREVAVLTGEYDDFDYTRDVFRMLGVEDRFYRARTISQVLNFMNAQ